MKRTALGEQGRAAMPWPDVPPEPTPEPEPPQPTPDVVHQ